MNTKSFLSNIFLTLTILISYTFAASAQDINRRDSNGLKQGKWQKTYSNGALRYQGTFKNGKPTGEFKYYYPSGEIKAVIKYSTDGKSSYAKTYRLNGNLLAEGKYIEKKRDSTWLFYSETDGKIITKKEYKNGKLDGKSIIFFPGKDIPSEITEYKNGMKNGISEKFYTDGTPFSLETYVNDTLNGKFIVRFPDGKPQIEGQYKNGNQSGMWITYDENGKIIKRERFNNGLPVKNDNKQNTR